jgi:hypothetical protein
MTRVSDPLAPLVLVVPSLRDGVRIRHALTRRLATGLFGVRLLTPRQLVDELSSVESEVADDLTISLVMGAVEQRFGPEQALAPKMMPKRVIDRYHRIRTASVFGTAVEDLTNFSLADREIVSRTYERLTQAGLIDMHDRYSAGIRVIDIQGGAFDEMTWVIGVVGTDLGEDESQLYAALARSDRYRQVSVGVDRAELLPARSSVGASVSRGPERLRYRSYPDPDSEVKGAIRGIVSQLEANPGTAVAIAYPPGAGYARRIRRELSAAGLEGFGRDPGRVGDSIAHRLLLGVCRLSLEGFDIAAILGEFASMPLRIGERALKNTLWEEVARECHLSRDAAVMGERLGAFLKDVTSQRPLHHAAHDLAQFITHLSELIDVLAQLDRWEAFADWFERTILPMVDNDQLADGDASRWERTCQTRLADRLRGLGRLDVVGITFDRATVSEVLEQLGTTSGPSGEHRGVGVEWMAIDEVAASDVEYLAILGMAEGTYPRGGESGDRPMVRGMVSSLHASVPEKEEYVLAVSMSQAMTVEVSMARAMDRTRRGEVGWSRYVAPQLEADLLVGLDDRPDGALYSTYRHALSDRMPLSVADYALRALASDGDPRRKERPAWDLTGRLMRATSVIDLREAPLVGAFDGVVDPRMVAILGTEERPLSVSALEHFASCPYGFFVRDVLRAPAPNRDEFTFALGKADQGLLVHDTMEAIVSDPRFQDMATSMSAEVRRELVEEHLSVRYAQACALGIAGARSLRHAQYHRLATQVDLLLGGLVELLAEVAGEGRVSHRPEVAFGAAAPLWVALEGERSVALRGRVDYLGVGSRRVVVVDYKTGSPTPFAKISESNPTAYGQKFQLGVYLYAAQWLTRDEPDRPMSARYLFAQRGGGSNVVGFDGTEEAMARVDHELSVLMTAMRDGVFLPLDHSERAYCDYCTMRDLGVAPSASQLGTKLTDPRAAALVEYQLLRSGSPS